MPETKTIRCAVCRARKPTSDFYPKNRRTCKACNITRAQAWQSAHDTPARKMKRRRQAARYYRQHIEEFRRRDQANRDKKLARYQANPEPARRAALRRYWRRKSALQPGQIELEIPLPGLPQNSGPASAKP